jgi:cysteine-rich repeat protein
MTGLSPLRAWVRLATASLLGTCFCACATGVEIERSGGSSADGGSSGDAGGAGASVQIGGGSGSGAAPEGGGSPATGGGGSPPGPVCGDGQVDAGETCDDGNVDNTDSCLATCVPASCGDGFTQAGVEQCDDGNVVSGDGCSATCTFGTTFGPVHTFEGMQSSFYVTQFACSQTGGDAAGDALWFCQHFYNNPSCTATSYTATSSASGALVMMHAGASCNNPDPAGFPIAGTACNGGPCKIGTYQGPLGGLADIVCSCL